jgi:pimeloyl-ACP methyl ester carboxylesterase
MQSRFGYRRGADHWDAGVMTQFTHDTAPTQYAEAGGIRFAYRRFGLPGRPPLVFFQHFMGNLDDHDPALSDAFATDREIILFDNAGVASSSGAVPDTIEAMARDAITVIGALGLTTIDVVAHSMGGLVAQEVTLARPDLVRRLVLAGTGPRGGEGIGARPAWVAELFTRKYERQEDMWLPILFAPTPASQAAGRAFIERIVARTDRDIPVSDQSIAAQRAAVAAYGEAKDPSYTHLSGLRLPVLVVNGSEDIVIPTINSYILQQFLPNAELILYPDANHGAHFQYPELFARHTRIFLDAKSLHDGDLMMTG